MIRSVICTVGAFCVTLGLVGSANAQGGGGSSVTTTGTFGQRTLGGGLTAGTGTTFGTDAGTLTGDERFLRENAQGFVGAASTPGNIGVAQAGGGGAGGGNPGGGAGFLQGLFGGGNQGRGLFGNQGDANRRTRADIRYRTAMRVGFEYRRPEPQSISQSIRSRLAKGSLQTRISEPRVRTLGPVTVEFADEGTPAGRTVILRGTVATQHDREIAAQLARLEPGVAAVQNELVVSPAPSADQ